MRTIKAALASRSLTAFVAGAMVWTLGFANIGNAQGTYRSSGLIDAGTTVVVRTNETIDAKDSDGRIYSGVVDQDVLNRNNRVAIPRGSDVELVVRRTSNNEVTLDLDSVSVNGQRYGVETEGNVVTSEQKEGLGANSRTGKYVGGGAVLGAIVGAIAGGGKGAAIGAGAGAAAGAGAQVLTRGRSVRVPAESLLTFRLAEPLRAGALDRGYSYNGVHYHNGYPDSYYSNSNSNSNSNINSNINRQKPGYYSNGRGDISIGGDKYVRWEGPDDSRIFVRVDNNPEQLFASGRSGTQEAPWITNGHFYTFMLRDGNGNEIARVDQDTRVNNRRRPAYQR